MKKRVAILGATGSIGKSAVDVIRLNEDVFEVVLLSSHQDRLGLLSLSEEFPNASLALTGVKDEKIKYFGKEGLIRAISECGGDIAVNGISGAAGLEPSLAVLDAKMDLALANKETIVMASSLVLSKAQKNNVKIIPVDSEHSAIFSLINAHGKDKIKNIILTASGGPFRKKTLEELKNVSVKDALSHPTWNMGSKITIDSATMANKGLEVIEAALFFNIDPQRIKVVVHPQSIVHSMVQCFDGSFYAQMSPPDMRLPIQSALFSPEIAFTPFNNIDFDNLTLNFFKPDTEKFPMLSLAYETLQAGGLYPAVYNAANEFAVEAFLHKNISFLDIPRIVKTVLEQNWTGDMTLESILETDVLARKMALKAIL